MTTPAQIRQDLRQFRDENREDHKGIADRLDSMNGTQKEHSIAIAKLCTEQEHSAKEISSLGSQVGTLFKRVARIDTARAKQVGWIAGAMFVAYGALEYVIHPILTRLFSGGE